MVFFPCSTGACFYGVLAMNEEERLLKKLRADLEEQRNSVPKEADKDAAYEAWYRSQTDVYNTDARRPK